MNDSPAPKTITTPEVERVRKLLDEVAVTESIGVIQGPNGTGKTTLLHAALAWHQSQKKPGKAVYFRCAKAQSLRGLRDLLAHLGSRQAEVQRGLSHAMLTRIAADIYREMQLSLLVLDEADLWHLDALTAFVGLNDQIRADGHAVTVLMAGAKPVKLWIGACGAGISRTLRIERIAPLDRTFTASVLKHWSPAGAKLFEQIHEKDAAATEALKLICQATGGNLRRLKYLSDLAKLHKAEFTPESLPSLLSKINNG